MRHSEKFSTLNWNTWPQILQHQAIWFDTNLETAHQWRSLGTNVPSILWLLCNTLSHISYMSAAPHLSRTDYNSSLAALRRARGGSAQQQLTVQEESFTLLQHHNTAHYSCKRTFAKITQSFKFTEKTPTGWKCYTSAFTFKTLC